MATTTTPQLKFDRAGIGLRLPHIAEVVATRPPVGWLEIHPENVLANPHATELLMELAREYPISVHTVGISIGSTAGIDRHHLKRLCSLIERIDAVFISGHLAWSTHGDEYLNDLLPLPFNEEALLVVATHIEEIQNALGRPYMIENPSSYVGFRNSTMTEAEFLSELVRRTGCRLLCDVSNVHLSAHNMGYDAHEYIDSLPGDAITELHLGGFTPEDDGANPGAELWVDTHAARLTEPAWELYAYAIRRFGMKPTLIEWDADIPPLETLLLEAWRANEIIAREVRCVARPIDTYTTNDGSRCQTWSPGSVGLADIQLGIRQAVVAGEDVGVASILTGGNNPGKRLQIHRRHYETSLVKVTCPHL